MFSDKKNDDDDDLYNFDQGAGNAMFNPYSKPPPPTAMRQTTAMKYVLFLFLYFLLELLLDQEHQQEVEWLQQLC